MPVNLSIKNVPDDLAERLRERARRNHRSLQGELLAILEGANGGSAPLTPRELFEAGHALGLTTPGEAVEIIRADRDGR
ncbi:MAG: Arc family DNA-binding protein [Chloroflexi bacterium]|nr:Arc family DNA-binding protein [Chloroflexota bacterium]MDA1240153.1 Arc family DNA-binding protein [Chloroflexota bacterium]